MFRVKWWQDRLYPTPESRGPVPSFITLLESYVKADSHLLDIGAGAGHLNAYNFKGKCAEMVGIDYDERVAQNPLLDRGIIVTNNDLPFADNSFDVIFTIYVLEHVADTKAFISEIKRVLKPGGVFLSVTPNRRHYVPTIARMTPTSFHKWFNKKRGVDEDDTFPTLYRMNTRSGLKKMFENAGFETVLLRALEVQPNYLMFSLPTFLLGAAYERLLNSSRLFSPFRVNIHCVFRKSV